MISPRQITRLIHINYVLAKHGLDEIILATHLFRPFRILYFMAPWNWVPRTRGPRAVRIRRALEYFRSGARLERIGLLSEDGAGAAG